MASVLLSGFAFGQTQPVSMPSLQADVETVYTLPDGKQIRNHGHVYRSHTGQVREDSAEGSVITDVAAGTVTILVTRTKEARIIRIPADQRVHSAKSNHPAPEVFEDAIVNGHPVAKARTKGPQGQSVEMWTAKDLGVVTRLKTESAGGLTTIKELQNLSTDEPNPLVFTVPADYKVIEQEFTVGNGRGGGGPKPGGSVPH